MIRDNSETPSYRTKRVYIKNAMNSLRDDFRYKTDSDSGEYYSEATGMGTFADVNDSVFQACVHQVFTEEAHEGEDVH